MRAGTGLLVGLLVVLCAPSPAYPYPADVELIPPGQYVEVAVREMGRAKSSIHLVMYLIALSPKKPESVVYQLLDALVEAHQRGVKVRVTVDENTEWSQDRETGFHTVSGKNELAVRYLQARGVPVGVDDATMFTHTKTLVIDGTTTLVGTANWSETALTQNVETNVLIRSAAFAQEVLHSLAGVARREPAVGMAGGVPVPWTLLGDPALLGRVVADADDRALNLYLLLLARFDGNPEGRVEIHDDAVRAALGIRARTWQISLRGVWRRLERKYRLLTVTARDRARTVWLKQPGDPTAPYQAPRDATVRVPPEYWTWQWDRTLTLRGKVMYLLSQHYAAISPVTPVWFGSQAWLAATHGVSSAFVGDGLRELRRHNLLDAQADVLAPGRYQQREANRYVLQPLYDPAVPAAQLAALRTQHGAGTVRRMAGYAALVYEDRDVGAIERLIRLEALHGPAVVRAAARKVGAMHGSNPKRTMAYLIATIEGMGREE